MQPMSCLQESFPCFGASCCPLGSTVARGLPRSRCCRTARAHAARTSTRADSSSGDGLPVFAHGLHPLDSPGADGPHSVRAASRCGAAHRPRPPDRSGSCSGHGAASFLFFGPGDQQSGHDSRIWRCPGAACWKWCCGGGPGQAASVRQLVPRLNATASMPMPFARL